MAALGNIAIRRLHLAGITQITPVVPCGRADSGPSFTLKRPGREQAISELLTLAR